MDSLQCSEISTAPNTKGFDLTSGKTWIYPENYPVRDYQFNIVEACLYNNTLVCLPTGLGKTFIAAVVMYNFSRWYPSGKVVFLAPTKPLVAQQIFACHNIMGIPSTESIELTGAVGHKQREIAWTKKRVIFATPQVFHNDLEKNVVPTDLIKCVVIDEAHRALGKHSYCECVRILSAKNENFRILALSATPGNKIDNVHEVLQNLLIARVELRDEKSPDIVPYVNRRKMDIILVPLSDELAEYKERYVYIMDRHVKFLLQHNVLRGQTANISKGRVFHLLKEHQKKTNKSGNYGQIMKTLNILMTMYHAYELMVRDGLRAFHKFYQNHSEKFWMNEEPQLQSLLQDVEAYLGPFPDVKALCEETATDVAVPQDLVFGHTKFGKLKELLLRHFKNSSEKEGDTRAIVFVEYRDIVSEIYILLLQCQPLIRPQMFVGQAGLKQRQQIKALENFRNNRVNVLISTSIGEEGLDVGEVDLIICFDVSQHSPTRLVQRMGRTGRKRDGHIIILVTDGREHETLKSTMARRDSLSHKILNTSHISSSLYRNNPRMIPDVFTPECRKMHITVHPKTPAAKSKVGKRRADKKENKRQNSVKVAALVSTESTLQCKADGSQFSMMKYLRGEEGREKASKKSPVGNRDGHKKSEARNAAKLSDAKILFSDGDAMDFLTACALRNSEREGNPRNEQKIDNRHLPEHPSTKNFFDFSIPDVTILACLSSLEHVVPFNRQTENSDDDCGYNDCQWTGNDSCDSECVFHDETTNAADPDDLDLNIDLDIDLDPEAELENPMDVGEDALDRERKRAEIDVPIALDRCTNSDRISRQLETACRTNARRYLETSELRAKDSLRELPDAAEQTCASKRDQNSLFDLRVSNDTRVNRPSNSVSPVSSDDPRATGSQGNRRVHSYQANDTQKFRQLGDERILTVTQAIREIARVNSNLNSNSSGVKVMNESEDDMFGDEGDMFEDEDVLLEIDRQLVLGRETPKRGFVERKDEKNVDETINLTDGKDSDVHDTEFHVEDFDWDDDFQVSPNPVQSCRKFSRFVEEEKKKKKGNEVARVDKRAETRRLDSEEWISVKKPFPKQTASSSTIAKKLANLSRSRSDAFKCDNFEHRFANKPDSIDYDGVSATAEETASSFFHRSIRDSAKKCNRNLGKKRRKRRNEFIDDEADVTGENWTTDENESEGDDLANDQDLDNFVSYTQNVHDSSDMHAHYLQTVKSPLKRHDGFLFKRQRSLDPNLQIYSQAEHDYVDESYVNDSFCVSGNEEEDGNGDEGIARDESLSELEKIEEELERRKRKRLRVEDSSRNAKKKRRNIVNRFNSSSSSSEDETEKLRQQILEESLLLKESR